MIDSIILMTDERTRRSFEAMSAEDAGNILKGLLRHAAGEEIDYNGWSPLALAVYPLIEGQVDRMTDLREKRSAAGRASAESKAATTCNKLATNFQQVATNDQQDATPLPVPVPEPIPVPVKEKEEPSAPRKSAPRFVPPTVEEVKAYVQEKKLHVDPDRFVSFYASKNWYVGKNKMVDWKAAIRGWSSRERPAEDKPYGREKIDYSAITRDLFVNDLKGATG